MRGIFAAAAKCCSSVAAVIFFSGPAASGNCSFDSVPPGSKVVALKTQLGSLCVELFADEAPAHVENFLYYLSSGRAENLFFHRAIPEKLLQIGGFSVGRSDFVPVSKRDVVVKNEPCVLDLPDPQRIGEKICAHRGNEPGTLALQKAAGEPDGGAPIGSSTWSITVPNSTGKRWLQRFWTARRWEL